MYGLGFRVRLSAIKLKVDQASLSEKIYVVVAEYWINSPGRASYFKAIVLASHPPPAKALL